MRIIDTDAHIDETDVTWERVPRHSRGRGNPEVLRSPGFRVALAIASLPGMTFELCCEFQFHDTIGTSGKSANV